ncbi:hypothetical protein Fmac_018990 [Flemingia macrophylla]|uniref:Uncharacterized protein n=1 Tax=Flemingia macrophylla TaxID=520843 RepID=A0ABD1M6J5_9FABA
MGSLSTHNTPFCTKMKPVFTWCSRNRKGLKFKLKEQNKEKGRQEQYPENLISTNFHQTTTQDIRLKIKSHVNRFLAHQRGKAVNAREEERVGQMNGGTVGERHGTEEWTRIHSNCS